MALCWQKQMKISSTTWRYCRQLWSRTGLCHSTGICCDSNALNAFIICVVLFVSGWGIRGVNPSEQSVQYHWNAQQHLSAAIIFSGTVDSNIFQIYQNLYIICHVFSKAHLGPGREECKIIYWHIGICIQSHPGLNRFHKCSFGSFWPLFHVVTFKGSYFSEWFECQFFWGKDFWAECCSWLSCLMSPFCVWRLDNLSKVHKQVAWNDETCARSAIIDGSTAVVADPSNFAKVGPKLKSNKDFVIEVVSLAGKCLEFAPEKLKDDEDVVRAAIQSKASKGLAIQFASERLRADFQMAQLAVQQDPGAIQFVDESPRQGHVLVDPSSSSWSVPACLLVYP